MAAAVVVACLAAACVCVLLLIHPLDRAREATRDHAAHSNDCARSTARYVAVVVVACVVATCVCVCVC